MKDSNGPTVVEILIVIVIAGLLVAMAIPLFQNTDSRLHKRYELWCEVYNRHDLTYKKWLEADKAGLIYRQP